MSTKQRADIARTLGMPNLPDPFLDWMCHVDDVITDANAAGLGVFDFADACWMDLYEAGRGQATDEEIIETLADADELFGMMREGE